MASEAAEGGLAGRYANAVFELAQEQKAVDAVSADLASLRRAMETSSDLNRLVRSPVFGAEDFANIEKWIALQPQATPDKDDVGPKEKPAPEPESRKGAAPPWHEPAVERVG